MKDDEGSLGTAHCKKMHVSKKLLPKKMMVKNLIFTNENWNFAAYRSIGQTYKRLNMVQNGSNFANFKMVSDPKSDTIQLCPAAPLRPQQDTPYSPGQLQRSCYATRLVFFCDGDICKWIDEQKT